MQFVLTNGRCLQQTTPNQQMKNSSKVFQSIPSMVHESRNITK
jgi:hypothetical protein